MRILAVSDVPSPYYYDNYAPGRLAEFDLILACGDLSRSYLEFLVTMARCPLLYVCGNHDDALDVNPPEGCICVEDQVYVYNGVRILGLGGSFRYRKGNHMFTEEQMRWRIRRLWLTLWRRRGFDILLTHAPARHVNDFDTIPHRGFRCFLFLLDKYKPKYFIHGHIHRNYGVDIPQKSRWGETTILNACGHCAFDYEE